MVSLSTVMTIAERHNDARSRICTLRQRIVRLCKCNWMLIRIMYRALIIFIGYIRYTWVAGRRSIRQSHAQDAGRWLKRRARSWKRQISRDRPDDGSPTSRRHIAPPFSLSGASSERRRWLLRPELSRLSSK